VQGGEEELAGEGGSFEGVEEEVGVGRRWGRSGVVEEELLDVVGKVRGEGRPGDGCSGGT
jgi:hypothetical protein